MEPISLFVQSPLFLKLSAPCLLILLIGIFWWRAGSIHSVLDRLWRLVAGRADVQDPMLKDFIQQNRDLEKFRFIYGIKIETQSDLHHLLAWLKENSINIIRLQQIKHWIDISSPNVIIAPPRSFFLRNGAIALLSMLSVLAATAIISTQTAWLQMKDSKVRFWTDGKTVHQTFDNWTIDASTCKKDIVKAQAITGFELSETIAICDGLEKNSLKEFARIAIKEQQLLGGGIAIVATLFIIISIFALNAADEARRLFKKLAQKKEKMSLPEDKPATKISTNKSRQSKNSHQKTNPSTNHHELEPPKEG